MQITYIRRRAVAVALLMVIVAIVGLEVSSLTKVYNSDIAVITAVGTAVAAYIAIMVAVFAAVVAVYPRFWLVVTRLGEDAGHPEGKAHG